MSYSTRYKQEVEICQLLAADLLKPENSINLGYFDIHKRLKFHALSAELSMEKSFITFDLIRLL